MSLTHIEYGSLASSSILNGNFEYLDDRITTYANNLVSNTSGIYSSLSGIRSSIAEQIDSINSDISDLENDLEEITNIIEAHNSAPDYSLGISITLPYTAESDGYVYAGVDGTDSVSYVYVNQKPVHGHCGYSGGYNVYSGSVFRVSKDDVISTNRASGLYYFYPMKGAD